MTFWSESGPRFEFVFLLLLIGSGITCGRPAAELSYTLTRPEWRPWGSCSPMQLGYNPCVAGSKNSVLFLGGSDRCELDAGSNNYLVGNPGFSFNLSNPGDALLHFQMCECYYGPESVDFRVNDLCTLNVKNGGYHNQNVGVRIRSISIPGSCFRDGENSISVIGTVTMALGEGSCPALSCLTAPMYADILFYEESEINTSEGTVAVGKNSTDYSFEVFIPEGMYGNVSLPGGSRNVSCGGDCEVSGGDVLLRQGNATLGYSLDSLLLGISFDNEHSAYFQEDSPTVFVSVADAGTPTSASVYFENGTQACVAESGFCEIRLGKGNVGLHNLVLEAVKSPSGKRGRANCSYVVEKRPEAVAAGENLSGETVSVVYHINNSAHGVFRNRIAYELPEDYLGDLEVTPYAGINWSNGTAVSFEAVCQEYSFCTYTLGYSVVGVTVSFGEPEYPVSAVVGEKIGRRNTVVLENLNPVRQMSKHVDVPGCDENCIVDSLLLPLEKKAFEFFFYEEGASDCGHWAVGGDDGSYVGCVEVPDGFPKSVSLDYPVPLGRLPGYSGGGEAFVDGEERPVSRQGDGLLIGLGLLSPGRHEITISYPQVDGLPMEIGAKPVGTKDAAEPVADAEIPDAGGSERPYENGDGKIPRSRISSVNGCTIGETVQIVFLAGDAPGTGMATFVSPSGKTFEFLVSGGRADYSFDEAGTWWVYFQGAEKSISVEGEKPPPTSGLVVERPEFHPIYMGGQTNPLDLGFLAVLLMLPFSAVSLLVYFVFRMTREPEIIVRKIRDGNRILLEVRNGGAPLTDVRITDQIPEGSLLGERGGGSVSETVFGRVIKWRLPGIEGGGTWRTAYEVETSGKLGPARLTGVDTNGRRIEASGESSLI